MEEGVPVQQGVPQRVMVAFSSLMRANPKSATFTFQFSSTSRLEGLRSLMHDHRLQGVQIVDAQRCRSQQAQPLRATGA